MPSKKASKPKEPTERVFLIDSFSHIFRAFFAPMGARTEPLTNSRGQVTQAVFVGLGFGGGAVVGSFAVEGGVRGLLAVIVSSDEDMCQLVGVLWVVCMR